MQNYNTQNISKILFLKNTKHTLRLFRRLMRTSSSSKSSSKKTPAPAPAAALAGNAVLALLEGVASVWRMVNTNEHEALFPDVSHA